MGQPEGVRAAGFLRGFAGFAQQRLMPRAGDEARLRRGNAIRSDALHKQLLQRGHALAGLRGDGDLFHSGLHPPRQIALVAGNHAPALLFRVPEDLAVGVCERLAEVEHDDGEIRVGHGALRALDAEPFHDIRALADARRVHQPHRDALKRE